MGIRIRKITIFFLINKNKNQKQLIVLRRKIEKRIDMREIKKKKVNDSPFERISQV